MRLRWADVREDAITIYDAKGRPGQGPRTHTVPLLPAAARELHGCDRVGEFAFSTRKGVKSGCTGLAGPQVDQRRSRGPAGAQSERTAFAGDPLTRQHPCPPYIASMRTKTTLAFDHAAVVADLKTRITSARLSAARAVNAELVGLY